MERIAYEEGYKYQLCQDYNVQLNFIPPEDIVTEYIKFDTTGYLRIKEGYAWDGPSGPTLDTKDSMRSSLCHDAIYQLMRERYLDSEIYRKFADNMFYKMCKEDGMCSARAWVWYQAVRWGAKSAADPKNDKVVLYAPEF